MTTQPFAISPSAFSEPGRRRDAGINCRTGYLVFLLANVAMFIRPGDFFPALAKLPIYEFLIFICLCLSLPAVKVQLTRQRLATAPITFCVLSLLGAVILSHLAHFKQWEARDSARAFLKLIVYYLLLVGLVDSPARFEKLIRCIVLCTLALALCAQLQYYGYLSLAAFRPLVQEDIADAGSMVLRLRAGGVFNDPNDFCLMLVGALSLAGFLVAASRTVTSQAIWFFSVVAFTIAIALTHSRGGLLALMAAVAAFLVERFGFRRALPLLILASGLVFLGFGGRQTEIDPGNDTGLTRLQVWSDGLDLLRQSPLFGIGQGEYQDQVGLVAHNSFLHCYTELGLIGGTLFLGSFVHGIWGLHRIGHTNVVHPNFMPVRPYLSGFITGTSAGMLSLSRPYILPTYTLLGIVAVYQQLMTPNSFHLDPAFFRRSATAGVVFLLGTYLFVRIFVRWG